jgi:hypothetical protein
MRFFLSRAAQGRAFAVSFSPAPGLVAEVTRYVLRPGDPARYAWVCGSFGTSRAECARGTAESLKDGFFFVRFAAATLAAA